MILEPLRIRTPRLDLVEVTADLAQADLVGDGSLALLLQVKIGSGWPPEHWEPQAIRWLIIKAREQPDERGWFGWYVVLRNGRLNPGESAAGATGPKGARTLIGTVGCKGPTDADGVVEVGYGIVKEHQRRGYASEATASLIDWALRDPRVKMIAAETFPHLIPSLGVMHKLGMHLIGDGSEPGVVRYGVTREQWRRAALGSSSA